MDKSFFESIGFAVVLNASLVWVGIAVNSLKFWENLINTKDDNEKVVADLGYLVDRGLVVEADGFGVVGVDVGGVEDLVVRMVGVGGRVL